MRCFVMECDDIARREGGKGGEGGVAAEAEAGGSATTAEGGEAEERAVPWLRHCADDAEQLLFFFALQHQYIQEQHRADPQKRDQPLPMSGDAKRQRFEFREAAAKQELPPSADKRAGARAAHNSKTVAKQSPGC